LSFAALFVKYDGYSSLWDEVGEWDSGEFLFDPAVAVSRMGPLLVKRSTEVAAPLVVKASISPPPER